MNRVPGGFLFPAPAPCEEELGERHRLLLSDLVPGLHCLTAGVQGEFQKGTGHFSMTLTMSASGGKSSQVKRFPLNLKHVES